MSKKNEIFTSEFIKEIGFIQQHEYISENFKGVKTTYKVEPPCGRAIDCRTNGMTVLSWNTDGPGINYFGEKIRENAIFFTIGKDGGTRNAFNGYIWTQDDVRDLLSKTW